VSTAVVVDRVTTIADCASVRGLVEAHARFEKSATVVPADWAARVGALIGAGRLDLFVARCASEPIGYATMTRDVSTWTIDWYAHLDCLFVADGHRDAGAGRALIEAVSQHARRSGLRELQWQTPDWNAAAIRFYGRLGARQLSKQRFSLSIG
jgi:GNAT superfamily N-acetyltransferase